MKIDHELKIFACYFKAVESGDKTFEIRNNFDRGFQKGDIIKLNELQEGRGLLTGRSVVVEITYLTNAFQKEDYVVFGFKKVDNIKRSSD